jgi:topoisomerase-4 subunit A
LQFKGDDTLKTAFFSETTSKILVLATNGKVFTLDVGKLPGGRGFGEPVRLYADIEEGEDIVCVMPYTAGQRMLIAASDGRGFFVNQDEMLSSNFSVSKSELKDWIGNRAEAGRLPPKGFPKNNRFS